MAKVFENQTLHHYLAAELKCYQNWILMCWKHFSQPGHWEVTISSRFGIMTLLTAVLWWLIERMQLYFLGNKLHFGSKFLGTTLKLLASNTRDTSCRKYGIKTWLNQNDLLSVNNSLSGKNLDYHTHRTRNFETF